MADFIEWQEKQDVRVKVIFSRKFEKLARRPTSLPVAGWLSALCRKRPQVHTGLVKHVGTFVAYLLQPLSLSLFRSLSLSQVITQDRVTGNSGCLAGPIWPCGCSLSPLSLSFRPLLNWPPSPSLGQVGACVISPERRNWIHIPYFGQKTVQNQLTWRGTKLTDLFFFLSFFLPPNLQLMTWLVGWCCFHWFNGSTLPLPFCPAVRTCHCETNYHFYAGPSHKFTWPHTLFAPDISFLFFLAFLCHRIIICHPHLQWLVWCTIHNSWELLMHTYLHTATSYCNFILWHFANFETLLNFSSYFFPLSFAIFYFHLSLHLSLCHWLQHLVQDTFLPTQPWDRPGQASIKTLDLTTKSPTYHFLLSYHHQSFHKVQVHHLHLHHICHHQHHLNILMVLLPLLLQVQAVHQFHSVAHLVPCWGPTCHCDQLLILIYHLNCHQCCHRRNQLLRKTTLDTHNPLRPVAMALFITRLNHRLLLLRNRGRGSLLALFSSPKWRPLHPVE